MSAVPTPDESVAARLLAPKQTSRSQLVAESEPPKTPDITSINGAQVELVPKSQDESPAAQLDARNQIRRRTRGADETSTKDVGFITKVEDGAYSAAGFVKQEAKITQQIAARVENITTVIEKDVDKVETFVHDANLTAETMEKDINQASMDLQRFSSSGTEAAPKPEISKDFLVPLGWGWNVFRIFLVVLTFVVVILHNWGGLNNLLFDNEQAPEISTGASSHTSSGTLLSMLLINLGPVVKILSFAKNIITSEKKIFEKVEEGVDEAARDVKKTAQTVEEVAHAVENVSKELEKDADHVQAFITTVKATTTTNRVTHIHDPQHQHQ